MTDLNILDNNLPPAPPAPVVPVLPVVPVPPATETAPVKEEITSVGVNFSPPKPKVPKILLYLLIGMFVAASVPMGVYLVKQRGVGDTRQLAQETCTYGETCNGNGTRTCTGTMQSGTCKYDPAVAPNCTECKTCGNGTCDPGEGHDNCPADCPATTTTPPPGDTCPGRCSGTPQCPSGQQCTKSGENCSQCKPMPGNLPGCCNSTADCADWETCEPGNGSCTSGKSCRSHAGCTHDTDCLPGQKCQGGTCTGAGSLECHADVNGVSIKNNGTVAVTGSVNYFASRCDSTGCRCSGQGKTDTINLAPGATWSKPMAGSGCAWQSDVETTTSPFSCSNANNGCDGNCGGTTPTPTPTPTRATTPTTTPPPGVTMVCQQILAYNQSWVQITDLKTIKKGQVIFLAVGGTTTEAQGITKGRFRINGGTWQETTSKKNGKFYIQYTVANAGAYNVESMIFNPVLGWQ